MLYDEFNAKEDGDHEFCKKTSDGIGDYTSECTLSSRKICMTRTGVKDNGASCKRG
jgi:hypothetical protein